MTDTYILIKSQKNRPPLWQKHYGILILKKVVALVRTIVGNIIFKQLKINRKVMFCITFEDQRESIFSPFSKFHCRP